MSDDQKFDMELDCKNLSCPLPVLKTKQAIGKLTPGQVLKMTSTDPGSNKDMASWSNRTGNPILKTEVVGNEHIFYIQRK
ncbi:MAG: sulfurtransferase TusA family protein [Deltaproteobacteria bacterium]|nr:sulfurtransferase TusA family protein [Deltaproteobacteria bacterium]